MDEQPKKPRVDVQMTGLAGELFVAAELLKRGLQTSVTFGNAKAIDLLAYNPKTKRNFTVQVKALREPNFYLIAHDHIEPEHAYVFVLLNRPGEPVRYFIVPGQDLHDHPEKFGRAFTSPKMPGINPRTLRDLGYEDAWAVFEVKSEH